MRMTDHSFLVPVAHLCPVHLRRGRPGEATAACCTSLYLCSASPLCSCAFGCEESWGYLWSEEHGRSNFILISADTQLFRSFLLEIRDVQCC